jgi:hypothetical protein
LSSSSTRSPSPFNDMVDKIRELTKFAPRRTREDCCSATRRSSVWRRRSTRCSARSCQRGAVQDPLGDRAEGDDRIRTAPEEGTKLEFDEEKFRAAFATDP